MASCPPAASRRPDGPPTSSPSLASLLNPASPPPAPRPAECPSQRRRSQPQLSSPGSRPLKRPRLQTLPAEPPSPSLASPPDILPALPDPSPTRADPTGPSRRSVRPATSDPVSSSPMPPPLRAASASYVLPNSNSDGVAYLLAPTNSLKLACSPTLPSKSLPPPRFPPHPSGSLAHRSVSHPLITSQAAPPSPASASIHTSPLVPPSQLPPPSTPPSARARSGKIQKRTSSVSESIPRASRVIQSDLEPGSEPLQPGSPKNSPSLPPQDSTRHVTPDHSLDHHPSPKADNETISLSAGVAMQTLLPAPDTYPHGLVPPEALEESIFGIGPYDDFAAEIGRFIWRLARPYWEHNEGHLIEIEAKLGILRSRGSESGTDERVYYPIGCEAPILVQNGTWFKSSMTINQHKAFNELLNERVMETGESGYLGARIKYSHTKETDEFYDIPNYQENYNHSNSHKHSDRKIRVSRCQQTGTIKSCIIKEKLGSLDISSPRYLFDFRVSVNLERPIAPPPPDARPTYRRHKDRLSYTHQICQVDLTQVKTDQQNVGEQHELEVEFINPKGLLDSAYVWNDGFGDDQSFLTYIKVWLNTVKLLNRNAIPDESR